MTLFVALGSSLLPIPIARYAGQRLGILDRPGELTVHQEPVPRTGGLAMLVGFLLAVAWARLRGYWSPSHTGMGSQIVRGLLLGLLLVTTAGLLDDVDCISPLRKFLLQFLGAAVALGYWTTTREFLLR